MSIATEIARLQQAKADIAEAIAKKGGEVSGTIDNYAQAIEALPSGGGISEEYYNKLVNDALDEPLIIPKDTVEIRHTHFQSLNATTETICPLLEFPEGSISKGIGVYAFRYARIKKIIVPKSNKLNASYIFSSNPVLEEIIMHTNAYGGYMCANCENLKRVIYTNGHPYIASNSFIGCTSLELVDLSKCSTVPTLASTNAFTNVPTSCKIRVPAALYDRWITATNWSTLYTNGYNFVAV